MKTASFVREHKEGCFFQNFAELFFSGSADGADTRAGTAADALITINDHVIAFRDTTDRAFTYTCTASNTSIFINNVSHRFTSKSVSIRYFFFKSII